MSADFCLRNPGATGSVQMRNWDGVSTAGLYPNFGQLAVATNVQMFAVADAVYLFRWDQLSDLIEDLDVLTWGATGVEIDKSGVSVDGYDADTNASTYRNETNTNTQIASQTFPPGSTQSLIRIDFTEGAESRGTTGNGVEDAAGATHDETSEDWSATFQLGAPTPGTVP
jgi:hypothetical protein